MLAVALPDLRRDFGVGYAEIAWLVSAYLIAMAVAQPLGGRLHQPDLLLVTARADYMLFVNGKAVGTLEAKKASLSQELRRMQA